MKHRWSDDNVVQWAQYYLDWNARGMGCSLKLMERLLGVSHSTIWWCFIHRLPGISSSLNDRVQVQISTRKGARLQR